jgi:chromate transport protein ChrA
MNPITYSLSVWITSLLLGPLAYYPLQLIMEPQYPHTFKYSLIYAFVFSLPSLILSILITYLIRNVSTSRAIKKIILSLAGIALIATPLYLIDSGRQTLEYSIAYSSITVIAIWLYPLSQGI